MTILAADLEKGLDLTVQPSWSGADANQLVDAGRPAADKGLIVTSTDASGVPDVPNATTTTRWQRYLWRRIKASGAPLLYAWNPNAVSDATYLKWQQITSSSVSSQTVIIVASYAALRAYDFTAAIELGTVAVVVLGYSTAGDGGAGLFRYDSSDTSSADDDGRVLCTTLGPVGGWRFKRVVAPGDFAQPEWFGGKVDVSTLAPAQANTIAMRKCVAYYRRMRLGVGTYTIDNKIIVPRNTVIVGAGNNLTTVKVVDNSPAVYAHAGGSYYAAFMWTIAGTTSSAIVGTTYLTLGDEGPCDNSRVSDLSVNCNYDNQQVDGSNRFVATMRAAELVGGNCTLSDLSAQQCGVGLGGGECFVYRIGTQSGQANKLDNHIVRCSYTNTGRPLWKGGTLAGYGWPSNLAGSGRANGWAGLEVTIIAMSLDGGSSPTTKQSGAVQGCMTRDVARSVTVYPNPLNGIAVSGSAACNVTNNKIVNFDGTCFYSDNTESNTQTTEGLIIANNVFSNVFRGVRLTSGYGTRQYHRCSIHDNEIALYNDDMMPTYNLASPPVGVLIDYAGAFTYSGDFVFRDLVVRNNRISGGGAFVPESGSDQFYSRGIYFSFSNGDEYESILCLNNVIDVPQYGPASPAYYFQEANSLALYMVFNDAQLNSSVNPRRANRLVMQGNRTAMGTQIPYMTVTTVGVLATYKQYQNTGVRFRTDDPIDTIANLDEIYPDEVGQYWYNTSKKRLWVAQDTKREVASGSLVQQRSYAVQSDTGVAAPTNKITYNGVDYDHNDQFVAIYGVNSYATVGDARVYESPVYCWQPLTRDAMQIFSVAVPNVNWAPTAYYDITTDRFLDSAFYVSFDGTDNDKVIYLPDPALYTGRSCYLAFSKAATTNPREISLSCKIAGVVTANKIVDPVSLDYVTNLLIAFPRAGLGPAGVAGTSLLGNVAIYSNGSAWFVTSQIVDPQEILTVRRGAASGADFVLTNDTRAPFYHELSTDANARQLKGLIYLEFSLTQNVGVYLPPPANWTGYQFKLAIRVGSGKTATLYTGTATLTRTGELINPGVSGNKGEIVDNCLVAAAMATNGIIVVEVTSMGSYWLVMCN